MNYWQVAAGEGARDYSSVFLEFGIMLIGSGDAGSYWDNKDYYGSRPWGHQVRFFAEHVAEGDRVILKRPHRRKERGEGKWQIQAVGQVTGKYEHLDQFDDVEGWDLQHCRRVEWVCPRDPKERIVTNGLAMGTFKRVHQREAIDKADRLLEEGEKRKAVTIPADARKMSDEDLIERLIENGLRAADSERVIQTIWRVRRLARWYERYGQDLSEHETRTFLIVPVLLALGWSEQKIKIEWKKIDITFFREVYKRSEEPCMILESKHIGEGLSYAERQAKRYAKLYPSCSRLVVSDGMCYKLYEDKGHEWVWKAYMNLLRLRDRHPYDTHIKGADHLFINLMPK